MSEKTKEVNKIQDTMYIVQYLHGETIYRALGVKYFVVSGVDLKSTVWSVDLE